MGHLISQIGNFLNPSEKIFPKCFKFGVVSFAEGEQDSSDFVIHGEKC